MKTKVRKKSSGLLLKTVCGGIGIAVLYLILRHFLPNLAALWAGIAIALLAILFFLTGRRSTAAPEPEPEIIPEAEKLSDEELITREAVKALAEMGRLYASISSQDIRTKINELMRLTDKIAQDAKEDPSDIPMIKKFFNYYLPTTIKLLHSYDRMSMQETSGENLDRSMKNIVEMLDDSVEAYRKLLDSLFENQALDIETDISVMNTMLKRQGLSGEKDFG